MDYESLFSAFFHTLADAGGAIALKYFRKAFAQEDKPDASPVTQADREIEQRLRELIGAGFPDHGIIGEEFGTTNADAEYVWVLDPIDGTKSFIMGRPLFGTVIGLLHRGVPVVGLVDQPFTRERWFGIAGEKASWNGQPIRIGPHCDLAQARLHTGSLHMFEGENFDGWLRLCRAAKVVQFATDCYAYGLIAMGCSDLFVEQRLKIYDIAGGVPIISGAGGFVSDWNFKPIGLDFNGLAVVASSESLARQAIEMFNKS